MSSPDQFAEERRALIVDIVRDEGRVRNTELAKLLGVSEPTVRKDLTALERSRMVRRTRGGAIAVEPVPERDMDTRAMVNRDAKLALARTCLDMIQPGSPIYIDSGTTLATLAEELVIPGVNVLTNSLPVAQILASRSQIRHTLVGGRLLTVAGSFVGPLAVSNLRSFTVDTAFIGAAGLTAEGMTVSDMSDGDVKQAVLDIARRVVLAIDSSKVGKSDFFRVEDLDRVDIVVTDKEVPQLATWCQRAGTQLVIAGRAGRS